MISDAMQPKFRISFAACRGKVDSIQIVVHEQATGETVGEARDV
jgi:hypothetical protein